MNDLPQDKALADRIFPIRVQGYTFYEKLQILTNITIPNLLKNIDVPLTFTEGAIKALMSYSHTEEGMRHIIQITQDAIRKFCFLEKSTCSLSFRTSECIKKWNSRIPITGEHIHAIINKDDIHTKEKLSMYS